MCEFISALVLRNGDLVCDPEHTDSHEDLVDSIGYADKGNDAFVRVEFLPPDGNYADANAYGLRVDEDVKPDWFNDALEQRIIESLRDRVRRMIVADERRMLLGGCWILAAGANVRRAVKARIFIMLGSSQVGKMLGSSQVGKMLDSSQVGKMLDSSQVGEMRGSSQVGKMRDSSQVGEMRDSSQVGTMFGSSQVGTMCGSSQVGTMCGSSQVGTMCDSSQVGTMFDSSQVGKMCDSSQVGTMCDSSQVGTMHSQSTIKAMSDTARVRETCASCFTGSKPN